MSREPCLFVIDNCEHLVDACADVVSELLQRTSNVRMLVTSRLSLKIEGEYVFQLGVLAISNPADTSASPAVEMFVERAMTIRSKFSSAPFREREIADICRALGGLPLAIEISAAQLAYMTPQDLLRRITSSLGYRRDSDPGATALAEVIDWSWSMLSPAQQALFARLSVFVGGLDSQCGPERMWTYGVRCERPGHSRGTQIGDPDGNGGWAL